MNEDYDKIKPNLEYKAEEELINVAWTNLSWISIAFKRRIQMLQFS